MSLILFQTTARTAIAGGIPNQK